MTNRNRSQRMRKLLSVAESEERQSGALAGTSLSQLQSEQQRLGELRAYRQDYDARARSLDKLHSAHWKDYRQFVTRLDQALSSQQGVVAECERKLAVFKERWVEKRKRMEMLQRVCERYSDEERQHTERLEQSRSDELPRPNNPFTQDSKRTE